MRVTDYLDFPPVTKKAFVVLMSLVLIVVSLCFLIHVRVQQSLVGYTIAEREEEVIELEERLRQLTLEKEVRTRPERIRERAHQWFGMKYSNE